jgi:hypothetical protein
MLAKTRSIRGYPYRRYQQGQVHPRIDQSLDMRFLK